MDICAACGESGSTNCKKEESDHELFLIYYNLTGTQLTEIMDLDRIVFCGTCTADLQHFDKFRKKCLATYEWLKEVKIEPWQLDATILTEVKMEKDEESETVKNAYKDEYPENIEEKEGTEEGNTELKDDDTEEESDEDEDEDEFMPSADCGTDADVAASVDDDDDDYDNDDDEEEEDEDDDLVYEVKKKKSKSNKNLAVKRRSRTKNREKANKREKLKFIDCPKCPSKFFYQHRLEAHLRVHEGLKPFLCKICGKSFITYRNFKTHHIQKHTDNKIAIPCGFPGCEAVFANKQGAKKHRLRTHDPNYQAPEQTPFICDICGNSYTTNGGLKRHKYCHNPEELPYKCSYCPKKYHTRSKLVNHTKRHQGILDFECPQCGLKKPTKYEVTQHIKNVHEKHTKTEPIPCNICQMVFSSKTCLKRHVDVVHRKIKRFSCTLCGFLFSQKDHLNRHMKSHKRQGDIASLPDPVPQNTQDE